MSKILSNREKNRRKLVKMHNSLESKMVGQNLIWWKSLSLKAQYSLLFSYIRYKKTFERSKPERKLKIKHFINRYRKSYNVSKTRYRETIIDHIIN